MSTTKQYVYIASTDIYIYIYITLTKIRSLSSPKAQTATSKKVFMHKDTKSQPSCPIYP
jgi:hypothetical protein